MFAMVCNRGRWFWGRTGFNNRKPLQSIAIHCKLALRLLRMARHSPSLEACLAREYTAALKVFAGHDFPEGIRAAVIDKDRLPRWSPARIEDVAKETIDAYFVAAEGETLTFGGRAASAEPPPAATAAATT